MGLSRAAAGGLIASLLLAGCGEQPAGNPRFALTDCRVARVTGSDGTAVAGIEDLALDGTFLVLSAHDRLAMRRPKAGTAVPEGGLWTLPVESLSQAAPYAARIIPEGQIEGGLRPHGIAVDSNRLALVNRRIGADGRPDPVVLSFDLSGREPRLLESWRAPGFCALNDVAFWQGELLATLDRSRCPSSILGEMLVPKESGKLLLLGDTGSRVLASGLAFANGVAVLPQGVIAVSETRGQRVRLSTGRTLAVPGHPDNLTVADNGRLVIGVIPSLWRFGLHLLGHRDSAPARIVALDPTSGVVEWLFDDPEGQLLPGITVGLLADGRLVAGAVRAPGLLVCERRA
jgi:hypothetical protein